MPELICVKSPSLSGALWTESREINVWVHSDEDQWPAKRNWPSTGANGPGIRHRVLADGSNATRSSELRFKLNHVKHPRRFVLRDPLVPEIRVQPGTKTLFILFRLGGHFLPSLPGVFAFIRRPAIRPAPRFERLRRASGKRRGATPTLSLGLREGYAGRGSVRSVLQDVSEQASIVWARRPDSGLSHAATTQALHRS